MRNENRLVSIRLLDGTAKRLPRFKADPLVEAKKAKYISNSKYRALTRPKKNLDPKGKQKSRQKKKASAKLK